MNSDNGPLVVVGPKNGPCACGGRMLWPDTEHTDNECVSREAISDSVVRQQAHARHMQATRPQCPTCLGQGRREGDSPLNPCPQCGGYGWL